LEGNRIMHAGSDTLFFMHIGKTAGSYLNRCFMEAFGADDVQNFCQDLIGPSYTTDYLDHFQGRAVISGHLYLADWTEFSRREGIHSRLATVLRSPLHQIVSVMRYLDGFNLPSRHPEADMMHPEEWELVLSLAKVDFEDAGSIDAFLTTLPPLGVKLLDNHQSRFFLCKERGDTSGYIARSDPLTPGAIPRLIQAFEQFDLVGLTERLPETLGLLSDLVHRPIQPFSSRINETTSLRTIDLQNEGIRRVLGKRVVVDEWLYRYAAERFALKPLRAGEMVGEAAAALTA